MAIKTITKAILVLSIFFIIFYLLFNPNSGYGPEMLEKVSKIVVEHSDKVTREEAELNKVRNNFDNLYYNLTRNNDREGCFISFSADEDHSYVFEQKGENITMDLMVGGSRTRTAEIDDAQLCAVYDTNGNFYDKWFAEGDQRTVPGGGDYQFFSKIIAGNTLLLPVKNKKAVGTGVGAVDIESSGKEFDYIDYLYKPERDKVCVIPLQDTGIFESSGCDKGENMVEEDCEDTFYDRISDGRIPKCG